MTEMNVVLQKNLKKYHAWSCQNVCDALTLLFDNIFIRFGTKLYRKVVGIPMGTNCAPLVAILFLFCYERDFMMSLSDDTQADVIDAFNTTSRYLDDILNIDNVILTIWYCLSKLTLEYSMTFYSVFVNLRKKCALDWCTITNLNELNHKSPIA